MSDKQPNITIAVDLTNPGQFFACCGLLELADRLWPGAEGWFEQEGREFNIQGESIGALREALERLVQHPPTVIEQLENGLPVKPIIAPLSIKLDEDKHIVLDGWIRIGLDKGKAVVMGNSPWNFWSGNQKSAGLWTALRTELTNQLKRLTTENLEQLFAQRLFQKGRFGFDPGPAWNALDAGFSPNEQGMQVQSSPGVELLAAVGLQRFRPLLNKSRNGFDYFSWHSPLPPIVAATAFAGGLLTSQTHRYHASVVSRGEYAALGFAFQILTGDSDE
jgi:CRISPR-associated protein Csx14